MATDAASPPRLTVPFEGVRSASADHVPGDAEVRITRQFAIFVGAGYLAYFVMCLDNISKSLSFMATWWAIGAPVVVFGSGIAVGVVAAVGARHLVRPAIVVAVVAYLVAALLTPLAWRHGMYGDERGLWYSQFPGLVGVAIGLGWPQKSALFYLAVLTTAATGMCRIVKPPQLNIALGPDLAFAFAYSVPFVVAVAIGVRTSRILDETRAETFDLVGRTAAAQARADERKRFDALTHDGVMTVLLGAARLGGSGSIQPLAVRTIAELGDQQVGSDDVSVSATLARLRSTVTDIDDNVVFSVARTPSFETVTYPQEVVRTASAATGEAVRNSIRHAGDTAQVTISVTAEDTALEIHIVDNGAGFELGTVPPHRLGIAVSIRGRMEQLPGGVAHIESTPGVGTRVTLRWADPS